MFRFLLILAILVVAHGIPAHRPVKLNYVKSRIVGGTDASITNYPYQARLFPNDGKDDYLCGGSILNKEYILTAAHCMIGMKSVRVAIGTDHLFEGGKTYTTTSFKIHPKYNGEAKDFDYDIAIINLKATPMDIDNKTSRATKLAAAGTSTPADTPVTITGWGSTSEGGSVSETLQHAEVKIVNETTCKAHYNKITSRMICAGVPEGGKDTCQGDSGGPMVKSSDQTQIGIVSFGKGCARPGVPGVYSNVANLRKWIKDNTGV